MAVRPIRGADSEDQSPLTKQCAIGRQERVTRVVNAGCFRGSAVELHDLEIAPLSESLFIFVAHIVSPDEKAREFARNLIDHPLQCLCLKVYTIAKNAALRVIPSLDKLNGFARG